MTETTQEERNTLRYYGERAESAQGVILAKAANDADRLAKLEDGIRGLVSEYEATPSNLSPSCVVEELRALLDGE